MVEPALRTISQLITLNEAEQGLFAAILHPRRVKRHEHLLREGEVCDFVLFITKGSLRYYYYNDVVERTGNFFFENAWYTDYESYLTQQPSTLNVEALEKCELLLFYKKELEALAEQHIVFEKLQRKMAERAFLGLKKRNDIFNTFHTPEERYLYLVKEKPLILARVAQHYIASYIGISPQSLSRIRRRITGPASGQKGDGEQPG